MAQRNKTNFKSTANTRFADNSTGDISPQDGRDMWGDVADSAMFLSDNFVDEDDMASDSATKAPSQQSVKAFVASQISGVETLVAIINTYLLLLTVRGSSPTALMGSHAIRFNHFEIPSRLQPGGYRVHAN